jgi:hypothetical protein
MNKQPKQMIVDSGEEIRGLADWALLHGIVIVSRAPARGDTVDDRAVHSAPGPTDCSLPGHGSRGDRKGQIERILQAQKSAFRKLRRYDK